MYIFTAGYGVPTGACDEFGSRIACIFQKGGKAAQESAFDAIHDTEAFIAANDDIIAVVFRGTKEVSDWATNLNLRTRDCPPEWVGAGILHEVRLLHVYYHSSLRANGRKLRVRNELYIKLLNEMK